MRYENKPLDTIQPCCSFLLKPKYGKKYFVRAPFTSFQFPSDTHVCIMCKKSQQNNDSIFMNDQCNPFGLLDLVLISIQFRLNVTQPSEGIGA